MPTLRERGRMQGLDGLRGLGALMVVFYHLAKNDLFPQWGWVLSGHIFVMVFFMLSGLVISFSAERISPFSIKTFMWRRFARVWPLHAAILFAMMGMHVLLWISSDKGIFEYFTGDHSLPSFLASLLLIHDMGIYEDVVWNGPSWSISVEFYAYVVFAGLLVFLGSRVWMGYVGTLLVALAVIAAFGGLGQLPYSWRFFYCLLGFFSGCLLFRIIRDEQVPDDAPRSLALWQAGLGAVFTICLQYDETYNWLSVPFFFVALLVVRELAFGRGWLTTLFSTQIFHFLGMISYAMYLAHIPLLNVFTRLEGLFPGLFGDGGLPFFLLVYFSCLVALSWGLYKLIEIPARKALTRPRPTAHVVENTA